MTTTYHSQSAAQHSISSIRYHDDSVSRSHRDTTMALPVKDALKIIRQYHITLALLHNHYSVCYNKTHSKIVRNIKFAGHYLNK